MPIARPSLRLFVLPLVPLLFAAPAVAAPPATTTLTASPTDGAAAAAALPPQRLSLTIGLGPLGSPDLGGAVFTIGGRYLPWRHLALSLDLGYGVEGGRAASATVEDRWWILPSVAFVLPVGRVDLEAGAGLGLAASSGYDSLGAYAAGPFSPTWAWQLVPWLDGYVAASLPATRHVDLFTRLDVGGLLLDGNTIGSRVGNPHPTAADTLTLALTVGVRFGRR